MTTYHLISIILAVICFASTMILGFFTDILHGSGIDSPYSFSKSQLWLWTMVIIPAFILHWGFGKDAYPSINSTSLILLGISAATTVAASGVAKSQNDLATTGTKLKAMLSTNGFWTDILTDDIGNLSLVRLQQFLFTLIYITVYLSVFFKDNSMQYPDFTNGGKDYSAFVLMGISTGTYVLGKSLNK